MLTEPEIRQRVNATVDSQRRVIRRWVEEAIARGEIIDLPANARPRSCSVSMTA